jgi:hypothetical protein
VGSRWLTAWSMARPGVQVVLWRTQWILDRRIGQHAFQRHGNIVLYCFGEPDIRILSWSRPCHRQSPCFLSYNILNLFLPCSLNECKYGKVVPVLK